MAFDYAGVEQLVRPILGFSAELPEPQRQALDAALGRTQLEALDPFLVGLGVLSLVAEAARADPVLIVIDDAQWLDDESVMALSLVGRRLLAERVRHAGRHHRLGRLPRALRDLPRLDLVGLPASEALEPVSRTRRVRLSTRPSPTSSLPAQGNPLALVELPTVLTADQLCGVDPLPDPLPIGDRLSGFFDAQVRRSMSMPGCCCSWLPRNHTAIRCCCAARPTRWATWSGTRRSGTSRRAA